jgi:1,4-dihydroxy-6-naphthoate synthase
MTALPSTPTSTSRQHLTRRSPSLGDDRRTGALSIAYTPDSDDAFNFYAWEHQRITLPDHDARFHRGHISMLNHAAAAGIHDVVAASAVMYPSLADRYWVLASGNSIGRGYGPVLASRRFDSCAALRGKRIGVADVSTTGGGLALMYCDGATLVSMPYHRIADAVASDQLDAGVMIHEELLYFPKKGLRRVCDLGAMWCEDTGLPLPVGLNLVRRSLGRELAREICRTCRDSLRYAHDHYDEALAFASRFGRGCAEQHIAMFSNADTLCLPRDARQALEIMCRRIGALGLGPEHTSVEIIDP